MRFIYGELRRIAQIAENIKLKTSFRTNLSHCVMDEVRIKAAKTRFLTPKKFANT